MNSFCLFCFSIRILSLFCICRCLVIRKHLCTGLTTRHSGNSFVLSLEFPFTLSLSLSFIQRCVLFFFVCLLLHILHPSSRVYSNAPRNAPRDLRRAVPRNDRQARQLDSRHKDPAKFRIVAGIFPKKKIQVAAFFLRCAFLPVQQDSFVQQPSGRRNLLLLPAMQMPRQWLL